jgi:hypothetical protein
MVLVVMMPKTEVKRKETRKDKVKNGRRRTRRARRARKNQGKIMNKPMKKLNELFQTSPNPPWKKLLIDDVNP